jgi:glycosyltransferase involved in cell wall biosynthesis
MAVHNAGSYLASSLGSALAQTCSDLEAIVVDDGSTDRTGEILREVRDGRVRVVSTAQRGLPDALNAGLSRAQGEWVARLDGDDLAEPSRLEQQLAYARRHPELVAIGSNARLIDADGRLLWEAQYPESHQGLMEDLLAARGAFPHSSLFIRRDVLTTLGGYDVRFRKSQDTDLLLRAARHGHIGCVPSALIRLRKHDASMSLSDGVPQIVFNLAAIVRSRLTDDLGQDPFRTLDSRDWVALLGRLQRIWARSGYRQASEARQQLRAIGISARGSRKLAIMRYVLTNPVVALAATEESLRARMVQRSIADARDWWRALRESPRG